MIVRRHKNKAYSCSECRDTADFRIWISLTRINLCTKCFTELKEKIGRFIY